MTHPQLLAFAILAAMMGLFVWGRLRYDLVAVLALLASVAAGTVPADKAFLGFADDIVIIVGSALVVSAAVARSGIIETALARVTARIPRVRWQLMVLVSSVTFLSALVKNIGALAMLIPAALRMAKKSDVSPSVFLMPMSFGSLLGGLITLIGTSPNIIVSRVREQMTGEPFGMFDYTPVGLCLALIGIVFLRAGGSREAYAPIEEGDRLQLKGSPEALQRAIAKGGLALVGHDRSVDAASRDVGVIEAVVTPDSVLAGRGAGQIELHERYGVNLLAISRSGERLTRKRSETSLQAGDIIVLQGPLDILPEQLRGLGFLPLAERTLTLGSVRRGLMPLGILALAMALTAMGVLPVAIAFFGAAALVILTGALPPREAYSHVEWPILIMLGALIPVAAMAVTPFLNNAATVLVMAPIAATFAEDIGLRPEAFLMAVAVGAGCDFLPPIGHQCNTLVMGPDGYRFSDYFRLGATLSVLVVLAGVPLIITFWPV